MVLAVEGVCGFDGGKWLRRRGCVRLRWCCGGCGEESVWLRWWCSCCGEEGVCGYDGGVAVVKRVCVAAMVVLLW